MYGAPPSITAEIYTEVPEALRIRGRSSEWLYGRGGAVPHSFLEGPSFDREGNLWLTDIVFGRIFRVNPAGAWTVVAEYDGEPNGLAFHREGLVFRILPGVSIGFVLARSRRMHLSLMYQARTALY